MSKSTGTATGLWGILKVKLEKQAEELARRLVNHPRFAELIGRVEPDTAKAIKEATDIISGYFDVGSNRHGPAWIVANEVLDEFLGTAADEIAKRATAPADQVGAIDEAIGKKLDKAVETALDRKVWADNGQCWPTDCGHRGKPFNKDARPITLADALATNIRLYNCGCWDHIAGGLSARTAPGTSSGSAPPASAVGAKNFGRFMCEFEAADYPAYLAFKAQYLGWIHQQPALKQAFNTVFGPKGAGEEQDFRFITAPGRELEEVIMLLEAYLAAQTATVSGTSAAESGPLGKLLDTLAQGPEAVVSLVKSEAGEFGELFDSLGASLNGAADYLGCEVRRMRAARIERTKPEREARLKRNEAYMRKRAADAKKTNWAVPAVVIVAVVAALFQRNILSIGKLEKYLPFHPYVCALLLAAAILVIVLVAKCGRRIYDFASPLEVPDPNQAGPQGTADTQQKGW